MQDNFFSPSFGNKPKIMVGRDNEIITLLAGLSSVPGSKERARFIIGQRGMGKTVLLLQLAEYAKKKGFIVASPTVVSHEMLNRIIEKLSVNNDKHRITGGSFGILGFSAGLQTESGQEENRSFAFKLQEICEFAEKKKKGVLILVDEVKASSEQLKQLIIAYQEMVGEGYNIALVMAGLPSSISGVLNEHVLTFLNRASRMNLLQIAFPEIAIYFKKSFEKLGIHISNKMIQEAAEETEGSPYMMQLVGHYITVISDENGNITKENFKYALDSARNEFIRDICETTLSPLSEKDILFLYAMTPDEKTSSMKSICSRMEVDPAYANIYKTRLIQAGIISQTGRGLVEFAVPYLRDYLRYSKL